MKSDKKFDRDIIKTAVATMPDDDDDVRHHGSYTIMSITRSL